MADEQHWSVDRRIPVAVLVMLFGQTAGAFWWAATVNTTLDNYKQRLDAVERQSVLIATQGNQLAAVEAQVKNVQDGIKELKTLVISMIPGQPRAPERR